jgi:uncharacterized membrane protein
MRAGSILTIPAAAAAAASTAAAAVAMTFQKRALGGVCLGRVLAAAAAAGGGVMLVALLGLGALIPLMMAYWFAPILVVFHDLTAADAMKTSFNACLNNILPFTVYSLVAAVLIILAAIPFGIGLVVLIPTMMASLYASYKDVFNPPPVAGGEIAM